MNKPEIREEHYFYFDLFNTLSRFRSWSEGIPNPITLSEMFHYFNELEIRDPDLRESTLFILSEMDDAYITHFSEKRKREIEDIKARK